MGRDLHEAERVRRLLPARVAISPSPAAARDALRIAEVVLLEDLDWPAKDKEALAEIRQLFAAHKLGLILSRRRGEHGEQDGLPVVTRPYRMEEVEDAMRLVLLRRKG